MPTRSLVLADRHEASFSLKAQGDSNQPGRRDWLGLSRDWSTNKSGGGSDYEGELRKALQLLKSRHDSELCLLFVDRTHRFMAGRTLRSPANFSTVRVKGLRSFDDKLQLSIRNSTTDAPLH